MSQVISPQVPSGSGLSVREAINAVLAALMSSNSGPSEPPNPIAFQIWGDTANNDLKIRNAANTAWVLLSDMIGALEYDRAQALTDTQQRQVIANIGQRIPYVVTSLRVFDTSYLNNTGGPLIASALGSSANNVTLTIEVSPDGASWSAVSEAFSGTSGATRTQVMAEVPNGWWYRYTRTAGANIARVVEWRRVAP